MKEKLLYLKTILAASCIVFLTSVAIAEENVKIDDDFFSLNNKNGDQNSILGFADQLFFPRLGNLDSMVSVEIFYNNECGNKCVELIHNILEIQNKTDDLLIFFHPVVLSQDDYTYAILEHIAFTFSKELFLKVHSFIYKNNFDNKDVVKQVLNLIEDPAIKEEFIKKLENEKRYNLGLEINSQLAEDFELKKLPTIMVNLTISDKDITIKDLKKLIEIERQKAIIEFVKTEDSSN